ncbi:hypothetical protein CEXT_216261 [Caerostris extrusa]|uniref:Uncharacterized protein n=1 Tax=Caerostris extrusa TaxID=172846 RepID=A0AAV4U993_CAEEX|nr:hypothetical protein CEXT_216261 [Caerostris extrusa]
MTELTRQRYIFKKQTQEVAKKKAVSLSLQGQKDQELWISPHPLHASVVSHCYRKIHYSERDGMKAGGGGRRKYFFLFLTRWKHVEEIRNYEHRMRGGRDSKPVKTPEFGGKYSNFLSQGVESYGPSCRAHGQPNPS